MIPFVQVLKFTGRGRTRPEDHNKTGRWASGTSGKKFTPYPEKFRAPYELNTQGDLALATNKPLDSPPMSPAQKKKAWVEAYKERKRREIGSVGSA